MSPVPAPKGKLTKTRKNSGGIVDVVEYRAPLGLRVLLFRNPIRFFGIPSNDRVLTRRGRPGNGIRLIGIGVEQTTPAEAAVGAPDQPNVF